MVVKNKVLVTDDGHFDLGTLFWDDNRFSEFLTRGNSIGQEQAMDIIRAMHEQLDKMESNTITLMDIEQIIEDKLVAFGLSKKAPVRIDSSFFKAEELVLSPNAVTVLERRYLKKDTDGKPLENPAQMFRRVARTIASAERAYGGEAAAEAMEYKFYEMMTELKFLPNSPTLMNAGRELGQLAACFVLPVEDSMEGIFDALKNAALIHKSGGGTGFSFSRLRSKHSRVGTTGGVASGPVSFMRIFNTATEQVKQGGTRRGANMAILRVDHPDILEFIDCKKNHNALNNFNISVAVTNAFMQALANDDQYELINPQDGTVAGQLMAAEVYQKLVNSAWETGDPGIVFLDRVNEANPTPAVGMIESTNPCGEQPLLPMEACNLGSINLSKFVDISGRNPAIDFNALTDTVTDAVRFLDDTIDVAQYPLPEIDRMVKGNRKIGLGVMGFADMLFQLKIPYNSEQALETAEAVMAHIQSVSHRASQALGEERGGFKNFEKSIYAGSNGKVMRNATTTTIAPTGTLSIIANCSSGIEPLFALSFVRNVMDNDKLLEVNPWFEQVARQRGFFSHEVMSTIASAGSIHHLEEIPPDVRRVFVTAHDITPQWHIRMQAAFQKYTDNAVSKTVNLPHDATVEDVRKVYDLAYELGCKGVTIYRDGSKENQVLSFGGDKAAKPGEGEMSTVLKRPSTLPGFTTRIKTGLGMLYVTVTEYKGRPFEVFATIGKSGRSTTAKTEAIGRLVSLAFRAGVPVEKVVQQLKGIGGEHPVFQEGGMVLSIPDGISRVLENRFLKKGNGKLSPSHYKSLLGETCPECGQTISFEEGCATCHFCGFSKCM
jgi:ribonucleoside-diphosphate reductase alpha chain